MPNKIPNLQVEHIYVFSQILDSRFQNKMSTKILESDTEHHDAEKGAQSIANEFKKKYVIEKTGTSYHH